MYASGGGGGTSAWAGGGGGPSCAWAGPGAAIAMAASGTARTSVFERIFWIRFMVVPSGTVLRSLVVGVVADDVGQLGPLVGRQHGGDGFVEARHARGAPGRDVRVGRAARRDRLGVEGVGLERGAEGLEVRVALAAIVVLLDG